MMAALTAASADDAPAAGTAEGPLPYPNEEDEEEEEGGGGGGGGGGGIAVAIAAGSLGAVAFTLGMGTTDALCWL